MELVTPGIGLIFWMSISFIILLIILRKFAWKPILKMLKEREISIEEALTAADKAREEAQVLDQKNKELQRKTNEKYLSMVDEIDKLRDQKMQELEEDSRKKAEQLMKKTHERIENEKQLAFLELKKDMADISVEIASKILREQLKSDQQANKFAQTLIDDMQLN